MGEHRISIRHDVMGGVPCVSNTRIPVATVVSMVANGMAPAEIIAEYPVLNADDVRSCLLYAARAVDDRHLPIRLTA